MAEGDGAKAKAAQRTQYIVGEIVRVRIARTDDDQPEAKAVEAFVPVPGDLFEAAHDEAAIAQHTGMGKDAKVGKWKAIPARNWRGVVIVDPPEQVLEDRRRTVADE